MFHLLFIGVLKKSEEEVTVSLTGKEVGVGCGWWILRVDSARLGIWHSSGTAVLSTCPRVLDYLCLPTHSYLLMAYLHMHSGMRGVA